MAVITKQQSKVQGTVITFGAAAAGDTLVPDDDAVLIVTNGDVAASVVTIVTPGTDKYGLARADITLSVAAGTTVAFGPFPDDLADPSTQTVAVNYSNLTSVTRAYIAA